MPAVASAKAGLLNQLRATVGEPASTRIYVIFILTMVVTGWGMLALPKGDLRLARGETRAATRVRERQRERCPHAEK